MPPRLALVLVCLTALLPVQSVAEDAERPDTRPVLVVLTLASDATEADLEPLLEVEEKAVWRLYRRGSLRQFFLLADRPGAVMVLEATGVDEAGALLDTLPMVAAGFIEAEVLPLRPFVNLEVLFSPRHRDEG